MKKLRVYEYGNCSTCKKALKYLDQKKIPYEKVPIVDQPPSIAELKKMLKEQGGDIKKLFNTSGVLYREMNMSEELKKMSSDDAVKLLSEHGKLVKRPFVLTEKGGLVGFKEEEWKKALA